MFKYILIALLFVQAFAGCDMLESESTHEARTRKMTYSYACVDSALAGNKTGKTISKVGDIFRDLAIDSREITDQVQNQWGEAFHKDAIESKTFVLLKDPALTAHLDKVMNELLAVREKPSSIRYSIYALDDTTVNAFTFGGHIYVTKAMIARTQGREDLLYSIIGHEIGHSEMGHIKKTIQEMQLAHDIFGAENGTAAFQIKKMLTASFNQHNELEADYYGTDLSYELGKDLCSAVTFWKEMAKEENQYNRLEDFFRTHPFSSLRAQCLTDHIRNNFHKDCSR